MSGPEIMDEMVKDPTLDSLLDFEPPATDERLREIIRVARRERAIFISKEK